MTEAKMAETPTNIGVFGVDPGGTTGWAYAKSVDVATLPAGECDMDMIASEMSGDENQQAYDLFRLIKQVWPVAVVIEDFIPQRLNKERHFLSPVRITAKLELLLWQDEKRWWRQMPSLAMNTITDQHLKAIDLWLPGSPHANDAQRHVLTYTRMLLKHPERHGQLISPRDINGGQMNG
jgi:hypothetical protein